MALWRTELTMSTLPEFVGTIHIFLGPYRGNPIALYLRQEDGSCQISRTIYPWNRFVGVGETVNKAAADFDLKWKKGELASEMYSGPHWEGGIKPEKPKPPPKPAAPKPSGAEAEKPAAPGATPSKPEGTSTAVVKAETATTTPQLQLADSTQTIPASPNAHSTPSPATEAGASPPEPPASSESASTPSLPPTDQSVDKPGS